MTSDSNPFPLILRILLLVVLVALCTLSLALSSFVFVPALLFMCVIVSASELVFFVGRTKTEFTDFLLAIKNDDFRMVQVSQKTKNTHRTLKEAQNLIIQEFQRVRSEREFHHFVLQQVLEHINTAVIAFDDTGKIVLFNEAAQKLLGTPSLPNLQWLEPVNPTLYNHLVKREANQTPIIELNNAQAHLKLSVKKSQFKLSNVWHNLVSITNITEEVNYTEVISWEKLIHVLTHEIMNSVTPLSSLSALLKEKAQLLTQSHPANEQISDLTDGLGVIEKRSLMLVDFVNNYRVLTALPKPAVEMIDAAEIFKRLKLLKQNDLAQRNISIRFGLKHPAINFKADPGLFEQVLINLINNATEAFTDHPNVAKKIEVEADIRNQETLFTVRDNGGGILPEQLDKIFVPFYTTKKKGSGIGLSLSRQIVRLHGGNITVQSEVGTGSIFTLTLPNQA